MLDHALASTVRSEGFQSDRVFRLINTLVEILPEIDGVNVLKDVAAAMRITTSGSAGRVRLCEFKAVNSG
jgi:hypothetical protein